MDSFINLAKKGLDTYNESQSGVKKTGGEEYNSPDNSAPGSGGRTHIDHEEAVNKAHEHGAGDKDLFQSALSFLGNNKEDHEKPVDEDEVTNAHRKAYDEGGASGLSATSLGSAAALQVLKKFTSGGSSSGGSQTELISMAMAEATKLFDKSGGGSSGNKQDAVNGAAMTVMKLLVQSKLGGGGSSFLGGSNSGGLGGLLSLASQFAK